VKPIRPCLKKIPNYETVSFHHINKELPPGKREFDSGMGPAIQFYSCKGNKNSVNKQNNFIILIKDAHMEWSRYGSYFTDGVVGIVTGVSDNFSTIIPLTEY
jgi:hypothetical protein